MWQGWVNLVLGIWMIVAGFVLPVTRTAVGINFTIVGVIILGFALWTALRRDYLSWVNVVMGIWAIVASWVLPIEKAAEGAEAARHPALWINYLVVGVIVIVFALLCALRKPKTVGETVAPETPVSEAGEEETTPTEGSES
ncbi:SPW repeat protein [Candidatus Poribacteria bacterium]|nr:SPW repeat protein [Candidatus Poribacteria bacterium]